MDPQVKAAPAPTRRVVIAIGSLAAGFVLSAFIGSIVIAAGGWDASVPAGIGSDVGRTVMQIVTGQTLSDHRIPLAIATLLNIPLWACLVGGPLLARREGLNWRRDLGWTMRKVDVPVGLAIGVLTQLLLVPLLYVPIFWLIGSRDVGEVARALTAGANTPLDILALVILTGVGAPIVEEILFRGLLHRGIADMMSDWGRSGAVIAVLASSAVFAASHIQLLQFPALMLFGIVAATAVQRTGRLGTSIWIHVGFNLTTVFFLLVSL